MSIKRTRLVRAAAFSVFCLMTILFAGGLYYWDGNREIVRYYKDYYECHGEVYGVDEMTWEEVRSRYESYRFVYQGYKIGDGKKKRCLKRLTRINSIGKCKLLPEKLFATGYGQNSYLEMFPYLSNNSYYRGFDLHFEENGRLIKCYDCLGVNTVKIDFNKNRDKAFIELDLDCDKNIDTCSMLYEYIMNYYTQKRIRYSQLSSDISWKSIVQCPYMLMRFIRNQAGFVEQFSCENFREKNIGNEITTVVFNDYSKSGRPRSVSFKNEMHNPCVDKYGSYGYDYVALDGERRKITVRSVPEMEIVLTYNSAKCVPTNIVCRVGDAIKMEEQLTYDNGNGNLLAMYSKKKVDNSLTTVQFTYDISGGLQRQQTTFSCSNQMQKVSFIEFSRSYSNGILVSHSEKEQDYSGVNRITETKIRNYRRMERCISRRNKEHKLMPVERFEHLGAVSLLFSVFENNDSETYIMRCLNGKKECVINDDGWHCVQREVRRRGEEIEVITKFLGLSKELKSAKSMGCAIKKSNLKPTEVRTCFYGEDKQPIEIGPLKWHGTIYKILNEGVEIQPFDIEGSPKSYAPLFNCNALRIQGSRQAGRSVMTCLDEIGGKPIDGMCNGVFSKVICEYDQKGRLEYYGFESVLEGHRPYEVKIEYDEKKQIIIERCYKNGNKVGVLYKFFGDKSDVGKESGYILDSWFINSTGSILRKFNINDLSYSFTEFDEVVSYVKCLLHGDGVIKDIDKGVAFLDLLVRRGNRDACLILGDLYRDEYFNRKVRHTKSEWWCLKKISDENLVRRAAQLYEAGNEYGEKLEEVKHEIERFRIIRRKKMFDDRRAGVEKVIMLPGNVPMCFCWCPSTYSSEWGKLSNGKDYYYMGSPSNELGRTYSDDFDRHQMIVSDGFWIAKFPVTQRQWMTVMHENPSYCKDDSMFVYNVSLTNSLVFCDRISKLIEKEGVLKLPTEIQWEYACRAGTTTALNNGTNISNEKGECVNLNELGWYNYNTEKYDATSQSALPPLHFSGMKANAWGIYGMHGGVYELCEKSNHDVFWNEVLEDSTNNVEFICRGGFHYSEPEDCRSSSRKSYYDDHFTGFRPIFIGN